MRHYEIVFLIYPGKSIKDFFSYYSKIIKDSNGFVHRFEDWGVMDLAYSINKLFRAHYVLINIEVFSNVILKLKDDFKINNLIIRFLVIKMKRAIKKVSCFYYKKNI